METEEVGTATTDDGLSVETTGETSEEMKANFASEPKPLDGSEDPKAEKKTRSEAAAELGKAGGEATAKARAEKDDLEVDAEGKPVEVEPEKTEPEAKEATAKAEPEPEKTEPEKGDELGADPRTSAQARVKQATKKLAEERDRNDALEARMDAMEAGQAPQRAEVAQAPEKPVRAQFVAGVDGDGEFIEALTDFKTEEKIQRLQVESEKQAKVEHAKAVAIRRADTFNERLEVERASDPEILTRVDQKILDTTPSSLLHPDQQQGPPNDILQAVFDSKHPAALMVYLTEHSEELDQIVGLSDTFSIFRAVAELDLRLTSESVKPASIPKEPSEPPVSSAKPPVKPVSGSAQHSEEEVSEDDDLDTHIRIYDAKDERARRGR